MKKILFVALSALLLPVFAAGQGTVNLSKDTSNIGKWIDKSFAKGTVPPFSFVYGGTPSGKIISKWKFSKTQLVPAFDNETLTEYRWTDPKTGFSVVCELTRFADANAVKWSLFLVNGSESQSYTIEDFLSVDLTGRLNSRDDSWTLHYNNGSKSDFTDFQPQVKTLEVGQKFDMVPNRGRSSDSAFPFFNIQNSDGGVIYAIGWSGNWKASISIPDSDRSKVGIGMEQFCAYLEPGEELRMPSATILFWEGEERLAGQNEFRRFMLAHNHPRFDGEPVVYPTCTSFNFGEPAPCEEYTCMTAEWGKALVNRYDMFGLTADAFWLDAGWYERAGMNPQGYKYGWYKAVGSWEADRTRFPDGLSELGDAVHNVGCKFMVWFEPERVYTNSAWAHEHPEYILKSDGHQIIPVEDVDKASNALLNLGDPDALQWLCQNMKRYISDGHIDYYRQDFNIAPLRYWRNHDTEGRIGVTEAKYVDGLYKYWDYLMVQFPYMLIDNCASGGRRIDMETCLRSAPLWRSDHSGEPESNQSQTMGLLQWVPVNGTGIFNQDVYDVRSAYSSAIIFGWKVTERANSLIRLRELMDEYAAIKPYYYEDFYPLTPTDNLSAMDIWVAYQLDRPVDGSGYVMAFRRPECKDDILTVQLYGIDPNTVYVIENQDDSSTVVTSGSALAEGLEIRSTKPREALLFKYYPKSE